MDGSQTTAHEARPAITNLDGKLIEEEGRELKNHDSEETALGETDRSSLTTVVTEFKARDCHHRILFGDPIRRSILIRKKGHLRVRQQFLPGARFVLDLWRRNTYGTLQWRCYVCETVAPGEEAQRVPQVIPGARILLSTKGAAESKIFLAWLYSLSHSGADILRIPRESFEAAHFRLKGSRLQGLHLNTLSGVF